MAGIRVVELAGIGPCPFAGMVLADLGADVVRVDRPPASPEAPLWDPTARGRRSVVVDLRHPEGPEVVLALVERADALIEGYRPGVAERLGIGPEPCLARRPSLVYGRITGWGRGGPLDQAAGRDINYLALSGTLAMIGRADGGLVPPVNLVADYGGGAMVLAVGVVAALVEAARTGRGQVVDAAMVDGAALLGALVHGLRATGQWGPRGTNLLDGGAWFYDVYRTADDRWVSFGAIDPSARAALIEGLGLTDVPPGAVRAEGAGPATGWSDPSTWPEMRRRVAAVVRQRTQAAWCTVFEGTDVCFAPVLEPEEAPRHPQLARRSTFVEVAGVRQPAPAPRFGRTPTATPAPPPAVGQHTGEVLGAWGLDTGAVARWRDQGVLG